MQQEDARAARVAACRLNPFTLQSHSAEKYLYLSNFDIQHWYLPLQDHTIATRLIPLSYEDGEALVHAFNSRSELVREDKAEKELETVTENDLLLLAKLEERAQNIIDELSPDQGVFVRLSTQSPKDVGFSSAGETVVSNEYKKVGCASDPNSKVIAIMNASGKSMQVFYGKEAISLLTSSQRINRSLIHALNNGRDFWDLKIVIRKWTPGIRIGREFRTFVCGGQLTAITQYNTYCFYEELVEKQEVIVQRILKAFNALKDQVPEVFKETAYIIDFAVIGLKEGKDEVVMVEINPFGLGTGAGLFDWEKDRRLLQGGKDIWGDLNSGAAGASEGPSYDASYITQTEFEVSQEYKQVVHTNEGSSAEPSTTTATTTTSKVYFRILGAPNPDVDNAFVSTFGIHIYLRDEDEEDEENDDSGEDEEEDKPGVEEFVDTFVNQEYLSGLVQKACGGRYNKRFLPALLAAAEEELPKDDKVVAFLKDHNLEWQHVTNAANRAVKDWYKYKIATN